MGEPRSSSSFSSTSQGSSFTTPPPPPLPPPSSSNKTTLLQPSHKKKHKTKVVRVFRSVFRSLPIITPCKFPSMPVGGPDGHHQHYKAINATGNKISGTLFGYRKGRVSLSLQETPKCLPSLVVELSIQTTTLQKEMALGMVRIALECEKRQDKDKTRLMEEPIWTMYCNGKKSGYIWCEERSNRGGSECDGAAEGCVNGCRCMLPGKAENVEGADGELAYMRAHFEHVIGSKDSETLYMLSPEGNCGPELTMFFVRV